MEERKNREQAEALRHFFLKKAVKTEINVK